MATRQAPKAVKERDTAADAAAKAEAEKADASTAKPVEAQVKQEQEQGFRGVEADPTPNHAYSVAGVIAGKPTPETDRDAAEVAALKHRRGY